MSGINEGSPDRRFQRTLLAVVCVVNFVGCIVSYVAFESAIAAGKVTIVSTYREWELQGGISKTWLEEYQNGTYSGDWAKLPTMLGTRAFRYVQVAMLVCIGVLMLNGALVLLVLYRTR